MLADWINDAVDKVWGLNAHHSTYWLTPLFWQMINDHHPWATLTDQVKIKIIQPLKFIQSKKALASKAKNDKKSEFTYFSMSFPVSGDQWCVWPTWISWNNNIIMWRQYFIRNYFGIRWVNLAAGSVDLWVQTNWKHGDKCLVVCTTLLYSSSLLQPAPVLPSYMITAVSTDIDILNHNLTTSQNSREHLLKASSDIRWLCWSNGLWK